MKNLHLKEISIQPELGVVMVSGEEKPLKPRAMAVLLLLAKNPNKLLSKRTLIDTIWGSAIVTDEVLTQAIYEIRQVFKGSIASEIIRTVPRKGYIFQPPAEQVSRLPLLEPWPVAFFVLLSISLILYGLNLSHLPDDGFLNENPSSPITTTDKRSIAVLPFTNRSNNEEDEFFVDGVHDDLLTTIAKVGDLKVISRTSVMAYRNTRKKITLIAKELGVVNILEGSVQRSGSKVRINVQLIDAVTDEHLWAEIFDRELTTHNLFEIQSEIAQKIADALQAVLSDDEKDRINTIPTENLQAYNAYLRGRQLMATRNSSQLKQAVDLFEEAVSLDPQFALAWVHLADATDLLSGYGALSRSSAITVMENAIDHALKIDPQLGEAYASQANIFEYYRRMEDAEAAYRLAIELSPNYATAYQWLSDLVFRRSRLRTTEALLLAKKAYELNPGSLIIGFNLATRYRNQGLYSIAENQLIDLIAQEPSFVKAYSGLGRMYSVDLGRYDLALETTLKSLLLDPDNPNTLMSLVEIYQQLGDADAIRELRKHVVELTGEDYWLASFVDVWVDITGSDLINTRAGLAAVLPHTGSNRFVKEFSGLLELIYGTTDGARELFVTANPGWLNQDQWPLLMQRDPRFACIFSWILINTGDIDKGNNLLQQTTALLDEDLPMAIEHADAWSPEICYLTSINKEKALTAMETQLKHNHLYWRDLYYSMPMYDLIRDEPRFIAVVKERERRISAQRDTLAQLDISNLP